MNRTRWWLRQHGRKRSHRTIEAARVHAGNRNAACGKTREWVPYPCYWGDTPEAPREAIPHYHVGRVKT